MADATEDFYAKENSGSNELKVPDTAASHSRQTTEESLEYQNASRFVENKNGENSLGQDNSGEPVKQDHWECELKDQSGQLQPHKVGTLFDLSCKSSVDVKNEWALGEGVEFSFADEKLKYSLHPKKVKTSSSSNFVLEVAAYRPGQFKDLSLTLRDKLGHSVSVEGLNFNIVSVLKPGPMPKPFGPYGPFSMTYPQAIWWGIGGLFLFMLIVVLRKIKRSIDRKKVIKGLMRYGAHGSESSGLQAISSSNFQEAEKRMKSNAYRYFHKELRGHLRKYQSFLQNRSQTFKLEQGRGFLEELDHSLRLFLVRFLMVPALDWKSKEVVREVKSRHRSIYKRDGKNLSHLLVEFDRAKGRSDKISQEDCDQFIYMTRKLVDSIGTSNLGVKQ